MHHNSYNYNNQAHMKAEKMCFKMAITNQVWMGGGGGGRSELNFKNTCFLPLAFYGLKGWSEQNMLT